MRKSGVTLVELLVALTIFALLLSSLFYATTVELRLWQNSVDKSNLLQVRQYILSRINRDVRKALAIGPTANRANLTLITSSGQISYRLESGKIRRQENASTAYLSDEDEIQTFILSYPKPKQIVVQIDNEITEVGLRN